MLDESMIKPTPMPKFIKSDKPLSEHEQKIVDCLNDLVKLISWGHESDVIIDKFHYVGGDSFDMDGILEWQIKFLSVKK